MSLLVTTFSMKFVEVRESWRKFEKVRESPRKLEKVGEGRGGREGRESASRTSSSIICI